MKRMRIVMVSAVLLVFSAAMLFAGGKQEPSGEEKTMSTESKEEAGSKFERLLQDKFVIYISNEALSGWQTTNTQFVKSLVERAGGKCRIYNAEFDAGKQSQQVDDAIVLKPDMVLIKPVDASGIVPSIKKLNEAGIPVISIDIKPANLSGVLTHIQTDQYLLGAINAEYLSERFSLKGVDSKVIGILGQLDISLGHDRWAGFSEKAEELGNVKIMGSVEAKWDSIKAMDATLDLLSRYPDTNSIYIMSDMMLQGVIQALNTQNKLYDISDDRHISIFSIDGDPTGLKYIRAGYVDHIAEHNAALHADIAFKVMVDYFNGFNIPSELEFAPFGITSENIDDPNRWGNYDIDNVSNWALMAHDRYIMKTEIK